MLFHNCAVIGLHDHSRGAYDFYPYYEFVNSEHRGMTPIALKILNSIQKEYVFELQRLPADRRYQSFERKRIDMILL